MTVENLIVIGDSHTSQYCFDNIKSFNEIKTITLVNAPGASIKGLLKKNSTVGLTTRINNLDINEKDTVLFVIGQCDVEFGYYYKSVLNGSKIDIDVFFDDLISKYEKFLNNFNHNFIVSGINPCTVLNNEYNFNINFKDNISHTTNILNETGELNQNIEFDNCKNIYNDSFNTRNYNHKYFNKKLSNMCIKNNFKFINIWDKITVNDFVKDKYKRSDENHHLIMSMELLEILYNELISL